MYSWMIKWTELTTMVHFRRSMAVMYTLHSLMRPKAKSAAQQKELRTTIKQSDDHMRF